MSISRWTESTYYEILEIDPAANGREVHNAYLKAKDTYSPESPALYTMFTPDEARELLKMIDEAFNVLSNQARRAEYDLSLAKSGHPSFLGLLKKLPLREDPPKKQKEVVVPASEKMPEILGSEGVALKGVRAVGEKEVIPEGFAKTRFGVYEVDKNFEEEMAKIDECDGSFIQKIRQYKKISLDQISDSTRINKSNLAAIENNAFDALPAPVFVRGFVLQMLRTIGAPDRIADAYMKHLRKSLA